MLKFAIKTLVADHTKLCIAVGGVIFALVLVNVQGGLFLGTMRKASVIIDSCDADIWVGHRGVTNVDLAGSIPQGWLNRVRGMEGVAEAEPYIVATTAMSLPNGCIEHVIVLGFDRATKLGRTDTVAEGSLHDLEQPDSISIDLLDTTKLGNVAVNDVVEVNGKRARIVAKTNGILGFTTAPYVYATLETAKKLTGVPLGYCSFFLVRTQPGVDVKQLCRRITQRIPELDAYSAADFSLKSKVYWALRTGIGLSFGGSTALGLAVGLLMVSQSLHAFVLDHRDDYAALKALGAEDAHIYRALVIQAMSIAALGIGSGTLLSYLIKASLSSPLLPIAMPWWLVTLGASIVVVLCLVSAVVPVLRTRKIDPFVVLQG